MTNHEAGNDVDVAADGVMPLLEVGQQVETPLGHGRISDISLVASDYGTQVEMEPKIMVDLDDPEEGIPNTIQVCMCKLGLGDEKKEAIIRKEFSRLWPPITDEIPQDSRMIVDVQNEFAETSNMTTPRDTEIKQFHKLYLGALQSDSLDPSILRDIQLVAYKKYVDLSRGSKKIRGRIGDSEEGMVVDVGADGGNESAVILKKKKGDEGFTRLLLFLPDSDSLKWVAVPEDVEFDGYDGRDDLGVEPHVYDDMRLNSPELHTIRRLPETYLPHDPNYPSSITTTLWRPTIRMTPIRYYNTREGALEVKPEHAPENEENLEANQQDLVNYPTPDFVPHEHHMAPYESGQPVYEYREDKRHPHAPEFIEPTDELVQSAADFWREYTLARQRYNPAFGSHLNKDVHQFVKDFMSLKDMSRDDALDLLRYMVQVGYFPPSVYDSTVDTFAADDVGMTTRTHYTNDA